MGNIRIGLIGCGVVGQGLMQLLHDNAEDIEGRLGGRIEVRHIIARDTSAPRGPHVDLAMVTGDPSAMFADPEVDIVVEIMGGIELADAYVRRALEAGKSVVTANKALLADRGHALFELAEKHGVDLYYEAAVAGGVPIIRVMREALASDRIRSVKGIINGTSNYILSRMHAEPGLDFADALAEAQQKGYAEADPTLDVGGGDAAHKLTLLATLAFGAQLSMDDVVVEGIDRVSALDIEFAQHFGFVLKPLAVGQRQADGSLDVRVHPALVDKNAPLAHVEGALNAVYVQGHTVGPVMLSGLGAGAGPTAASVVSDIIDVGRNLASQASGRVPERGFGAAHIRRPAVQPIEAHSCRFYLRFSARDRSGVLGRIASALGEQGVSIAQMEQTGRAQEPVSVVMLTHPATEGAVRAALEQIDAHEDVLRPTCALRIEDA